MNAEVMRHVCQELFTVDQGHTRQFMVIGEVADRSRRDGHDAYLRVAFTFY